MKYVKGPQPDIITHVSDHRAFRKEIGSLSKNQVSHQEPNKKLDETWEGLYQVLRAHINGSYILTDGEGRKLAKTWNDTNLCK